MAPPCVWVSDLSVPVSPSDIANFFGKIGTVKDVIVPDMDSGSALIVFVDHSSVDKALAWNGKNLRDQVIRVDIPTSSQLEVLFSSDSKNTQPVSVVDKLRTEFMKLDPSNMLSLLQEFTNLAQKHCEPYHPTGSLIPPDPVSPSGAASSFGFQNVPIHPTNPPVSHSPGFLPVQQYPKIAFFSGEEGKSGDVKFGQWRSEVVSLMNEGYSEPVILQGIRRSLRGTAAEVLHNLPRPVSVTDILTKFDVVFGIVLSMEHLLEDFYNATQLPTEKVVVWGCRLESILSRLRERGLSSDSNAMLRSRFWHGLSDLKIKNALRHKFDNGDSFQELLTSARSVEHESTRVVLSEVKVIDKQICDPKQSSTAKVNVQQTSSLEKTLQEFGNQLVSIKKEIAKLKEGGMNKSSGQIPSSFSKLECFYCHEVGHVIRDCVKLKRKNELSKNSGNWK